VHSNFFAAWLAGFTVCLSLIVSIGAQNLYVLRQAVLERHVRACVAWCVACDVVLIACGVAGMARLLAKRPDWAYWLGVGGVGFMLLYGLFALWRMVSATHTAPSSAASGDGGRSLQAVVGTLAVITLFNPHVYLDTVLLVGTIGARQEGEHFRDFHHHHGHLFHFSFPGENQVRSHGAEITRSRLIPVVAVARLVRAFSLLVQCGGGACCAWRSCAWPAAVFCGFWGVLMISRLAIIFDAYLRRIEAMPPPTSHQQAHDMLKSMGREVMLEFGASRQWLAELDARRMCAEDGWINLDANPCYWESRESEKIRIYLYRDGSIVMQRKNPAHPRIFFSKIGGALAKSTL